MKGEPFTRLARDQRRLVILAGDALGNVHYFTQDWLEMSGVKMTFRDATPTREIELSFKEKRFTTHSDLVCNENSLPPSALLTCSEGSRTVALIPLRSHDKKEVLCLAGFDKATGQWYVNRESEAIKYVLDQRAFATEIYTAMDWPSELPLNFRM